MKLGFRGSHPVTNLIFFVFAFTLSLTVTNPAVLAVCFLCGLIYDLKLGKEKAKSYILKFIFPVISLITVFNCIFSHYGVTVLFVMKSGNNFTLEAIIYGFVSGIKIASMLLWLDCFNEIITSEKIIFLFGRFSPRLALILSMVLRFIPLIRTQSSEILKAEKGIGGYAEKSDFVGKIKSAARRLSVLVSWTLERGIDTSDSMLARGYGLKGRTSYNDYSFIISDAVMLTLSISALASIFISEKHLEASYNPIIDIPKPNLISILFTALFAAVLIMPLIFDIREEKRWSISK